MHTIEFVPATWLERSAGAVIPGMTLMCYSRPVAVERRVFTRRADDVTRLLRTLQLPEVA